MSLPQHGVIIAHFDAESYAPLSSNISKLVRKQITCYIPALQPSAPSAMAMHVSGSSVMPQRVL